MFTRSIMAVAVLSFVGLALVSPSNAYAAPLKDRISVGSTGSVSLAGTISGITGTTLTVKSWGKSFTMVVDELTKFSPTIKGSTLTPSQRLAAYGIGDSVTVTGKISTTTFITTVKTITNYTERTSGSAVYQVKKIIQGSFTEVVPNTRVKIRETTTGIVYTLALNGDSILYDKSGKKVTGDLTGWNVGNDAYAYAMLSGTSGIAIYVKNKTYSAPTGSVGAVPPPPPPPSTP